MTFLYVVLSIFLTFTWMSKQSLYKFEFISFTDVSTFCKYCPLCKMTYRYQEWTDGLHNYDDHIILGLHFCLYLRASLQVWTKYSFAVLYGVLICPLSVLIIPLSVLIFPLSDTQCSKQGFWSHRAVIWDCTAQSQQATSCIFTLWSPYCTWIHIFLC